LAGILAEEEVLRALLAPISGEGEGGTKEDDAAVRESLAEAVVALAGTEEGCSRLWDLEAPRLLARGCGVRFLLHHLNYLPRANVGDTLHSREGNSNNRKKKHRKEKLRKKNK
jgi:hypothetical protein